MAARSVSIGVRGATNSICGVRGGGAGSFRRSSLPLALNGSASTRT
jgi:hypothetical protein